MIGVTLLFLASIGALIGWGTNLLAVRMLFRPFEPIEIPLIHFKIQGLIPKRKEEIARSIGNTVQEELLSIEEILEQFVDKQDQGEILLIIKHRIGQIINNRLPAIIPSALKEVFKNYINDIIDEEGSKMISSTIKNMIHHSASNINLAEMVESRINQFPMDKLEEIVLKIAKKELKYIEIIGGILGFIIGLLQGIIIVLL